MDEYDGLAQRFEAHKTHLRAVATGCSALHFLKVGPIMPLTRVEDFLHPLGVGRSFDLSQESLHPSVVFL